jgi:hypothetical protein
LDILAKDQGKIVNGESGTQTLDLGFTGRVFCHRAAAAEQYNLLFFNQKCDKFYFTFEFDVRI